MKRRSNDRRGLAEIVGTLMLVLIVVAAAVAFSLFVASYEAQLTNEERAAHDRQLESLRITSISIVTDTYLVLHIASGDVNWMNLTGYAVNGVQAPTWTYTSAGGGPQSCTWPANTSSCTELGPLANATLTLWGFGTLLPSQEIHLVVYTKLSNQFSYLFLPPVPIIRATILPVGAESVPLFDGSASYEPSGADNATIAEYNWSFEPSFRGFAGSFTVNATPYWSTVDLSFTTMNPVNPLPPESGIVENVSCAERVCFDETNLPNGINWSVYYDSGTLCGSNVTNTTALSAPGEISCNPQIGGHPYEVVVHGPSPPLIYNGPEVEVEPLSTVAPSDAVYWYVTLTVVDTDGLSTSTFVVYET